MDSAQQIAAVSLYACTLTIWVIAERWRLARLTDSPLISFLGVLFTLCFAAQALCFSVAASVALNWRG